MSTYFWKNFAANNLLVKLGIKLMNGYYYSHFTEQENKAKRVCDSCKIQSKYVK